MGSAAFSSAYYIRFAKHNISFFAQFLWSQGIQIKYIQNFSNNYIISN